MFNVNLLLSILLFFHFNCVGPPPVRERPGHRPQPEPGQRGDAAVGRERGGQAAAAGLRQDEDGASLRNQDQRGEEPRGHH